ncbi:hypothetical protein QBZ16_004514 [Prototheca wickerhamii]|uniref:Uncharacterized protein n=1 Tax=Prototheca wickerhamii TaxID=3111 RepID=A0AAD9IHH2_PROWI|nr:hypothetical protein QBZ16_004514 [Prototheca wickerhamii]
MQQGGTGPGAAAERMDEPTRYAPFSLERKSAEPAESVDLENGDTSLLHKAESRLSRRGLYGLLIGNIVLLLLVAWEVALFINNQHLHNASEQDVVPHLKFLVIGDWGRDGQYGQRAVAAQMAAKAATFSPDFVVSTGDK